MSDRKFYAYIHRARGAIFYIGKGCGNRAYNVTNRSALWRSRAGDEIVVEVLPCDSEEDALALERFLIGSLRVFGVPLANKAAGGNSNSGARFSEESRRRMSIARKGMKFTLEHRQNISLSHRGKTGAANNFFGRQHTEATKQRLSEAQRGGKSHRARAVLCCDTGVLFPSLSEAAAWLKTVGVERPSSGALSWAAQGKAKRAYGRVWRYQ